MSHLDISGILAKVTKMPDDARRFTVRADRAVADFRVSPELQDELLAAGLPNMSNCGTRYFDKTDLLNISLHLDIGSRQRKVLAWWQRELDFPYGDSISYRVDYITSCPQPGHVGRCTFELLEPGLNWVELTTSDQRAHMRHSITFTLNRNVPELPCSMREIIDEVQQIDFMRLPASLRSDVEFIRREKVGDCAGITKVIVAKAASRGVTARTSYGLALTPPFATPHYWAEFFIDDTWVPVDPVFITALLEWGILDNDRWSRYHSIGRILARMGEAKKTLSVHNGQPTDSKLQVYRVSEPSQLLNINSAFSSPPAFQN